MDSGNTIFSRKFPVFGLLIILACAFFTTCNNPVMEKWWPEKQTSEIIICECSGVNFAVIYLDVNGGKTQDDENYMMPFRVLYNTKVPRVRSLIAPTLPAGLGFGGWLDENGNLWDMETRLVKPSDDADNDGVITLTAQWKINYVTITFDTNYDHIFANPSDYPKNKDGTGVTITVADQKIIPGNRIIEPPVLPADGIHGLLGWDTNDGSPTAVLDSNGKDPGLDDPSWGEKWDFEKIVTGPVNGTIHLHARWSTYSRTVHLQVNGGTRPDCKTELTRVNFTVFTGLGGTTGGKIIDPGPLVREGHTFAGWFTDSGSTAWNFMTDKVYDVDDWDTTVTPNRLRNEAFILHAIWVPNIYYVTFKADGGTPAPPRQEIEHGNRVTLPPPMSKTDKAFDGWLSDAGTLWNFDKGVTRSMTLTAVWVDKLYTVTFHLGNPPEKLPTQAGLHKVYLDAQPKVQYVKTSGKVIEPFMPALPADAVAKNWSFVRWDYASGYTGNPDTIDRTDANTDGLTEWNFSNSVTNDMTLYARWVEAAPDMVWVPGGNFVMGDSGVSGSPVDCHAYPTRRVTLDGFYISRYEITQVGRADTNKSYTDVMGMNPSQFYLDEVRPVERVSWFDAVEYCNKLTEQTTGMSSADNVYTISYNPTSDRILVASTGGTRPAAYSIINATVTANFNQRGYRLPTEAEWEYAARGGHNSPGNFIYAGSNDATAVAWFNTTVATQGSGAAQRVGRLNANALGICDMSGNISEWVWDKFVSYKDSYYTVGTDSLDNPRGPSGNSGPTGSEQRVRRGGAWSNAISNVRCVVRNSDAAKTATWVNGFRVVRGPGQIW